MICTIILKLFVYKTVHENSAVFIYKLFVIWTNENKYQRIPKKLYFNKK